MLVKRLQQLSCSTEWPGIRVQLAVDVAGAAVDLLGSRGVDRLARCLGDDLGHAAAVRSDEPGHLRAVSWYSAFREGAQPGDDPGLDGVDQRPVEVEQP